MNPVFDHMAFNNAPHIAYALRRPAVLTQAGLDTWGFDFKANGVNRGGIMLDPGHSGFQVRCDLVHTHHQDHLFRPECHRRNSIAHPVKVDQSTVQGNRICAGNHDIGCQALA